MSNIPFPAWVDGIIVFDGDDELDQHANLKLYGFGVVDDGESILVTAPTEAANGLVLSLATGTPTPSSDLTAATTLYLTPYTSSAIVLFDGQRWIRRLTGEVSISLASIAAATNYDVFAQWNGTAVVLSLLAWTSDTVRVALGAQDGIPVKGDDATKRFVGTIRGSAAGQCEDSQAKRFVDTLGRVQPRPMNVKEATATWTYTVATWRQVRAQAANQVEFVACQPCQVAARARAVVANSSAGVAVAAGIGIDSTTVNSAMFSGGVTNVANQKVYPTAEYEGRLAAGYHKIAWLEASAATGTSTWTGTNGVFDQSGLVAEVSSA